MDEINQRRLFKLDFYAAPMTWKSTGKRLLVFMDANEYTTDRKFMRRLMKDSILDLAEEIHRDWEEEAPHTYIKTKYPIDYVLDTKDVEITRFLM